MLRVERNLMHRRAHFGRCRSHLIDGGVFAADQAVIGLSHAGHATSSGFDLGSDASNLRDQRLQLVEKAVKGCAELAQFIGRAHLKASPQVAIAFGDLLQAVKQPPHRPQHHQREAKNQHNAA